MKGEGKVKKAIKESFKILNELKCVLVYEGRSVYPCGNTDVSTVCLCV